MSLLLLSLCLVLLLFTPIGTSLHRSPIQLTPSVLRFAETPRYVPITSEFVLANGACHAIDILSVRTTDARFVVNSIEPSHISPGQFSVIRLSFVSNSSNPVTAKLVVTLTAVKTTELSPCSSIESIDYSKSLDFSSSLFGAESLESYELDLDQNQVLFRNVPYIDSAVHLYNHLFSPLFILEVFSSDSFVSLKSDMGLEHVRVSSNRLVSKLGESSHSNWKVGPNSGCTIASISIDTSIKPGRYTSFISIVTDHDKLVFPFTFAIKEPTLFLANPLHLTSSSQANEIVSTSVIIVNEYATNYYITEAATVHCASSDLQSRFAFEFQLFPHATIEMASSATTSQLSEVGKLSLVTSELGEYCGYLVLKLEDSNYESFEMRFSILGEVQHPHLHFKESDTIFYFVRGAANNSLSTSHGVTVTNKLYARSRLEYVSVLTCGEFLSIDSSLIHRQEREHGESWPRINITFSVTHLQDQLAISHSKTCWIEVETNISSTRIPIFLTNSGLAVHSFEANNWSKGAGEEFQVQLSVAQETKLVEWRFSVVNNNSFKDMLTFNRVKMLTTESFVICRLAAWPIFSVRDSIQQHSAVNWQSPLLANSQECIQSNSDTFDRGFSIPSGYIVEFTVIMGSSIEKVTITGGSLLDTLVFHLSWPAYEIGMLNYQMSLDFFAIPFEVTFVANRSIVLYPHDELNSFAEYCNQQNSTDVSIESSVVGSVSSLDPKIKVISSRISAPCVSIDVSIQLRCFAGESGRIPLIQRCANELLDSNTCLACSSHSIDVWTAVDTPSSVPSFGFELADRVSSHLSSLSWELKESNFHLGSILLRYNSLSSQHLLPPGRLYVALPLKHDIELRIPSSRTAVVQFVVVNRLPMAVSLSVTILSVNSKISILYERNVVDSCSLVQKHIVDSGDIGLLSEANVRIHVPINVTANYVSRVESSAKIGQLILAPGEKAAFPVVMFLSEGTNNMEVHMYNNFSGLESIHVSVEQIPYSLDISLTDSADGDQIVIDNRGPFSALIDGVFFDQWIGQQSFYTLSELSLSKNHAPVILLPGHRFSISASSFASCFAALHTVNITLIGVSGWNLSSACNLVWPNCDKKICFASPLFYKSIFAMFLIAIAFFLLIRSRGLVRPSYCCNDDTSVAVESKVSMLELRHHVDFHRCTLESPTISTENLCRFKVSDEYVFSIDLFPITKNDRSPQCCLPPEELADALPNAREDLSQQCLESLEELVVLQSNAEEDQQRQSLQSPEAMVIAPPNVNTSGRSIDNWMTSSFPRSDTEEEMSTPLSETNAVVEALFEVHSGTFPLEPVPTFLWDSVASSEFEIYHDLIFDQQTRAVADMVLNSDND